VDTVALPASGEVAQATNGRAARSPRAAAGRKSRTAQQRLDKAQAGVLASLETVSSYLDADEDLPVFFGRLSQAIAEQVGASKAAFWWIGPRGTLSLQPDPFGFDGDSSIRAVRLQLGANGEGVLERVIFRDKLDLTKGTSPELDDMWRQLGLVGVKNSIAVAWRAGERRIGAVVAYDSRRGFTADDLWVLRMAGIATGLVWQYKEAEDDLAQTAVRLEEAVAARRHLLNNIASGGDEARRRFASALHDDSLQLLTGAELQLERLRAESNGSHLTVQLDQLRNTLRKVEDSLRRLLANVSPEPLQLPHDLRQAIGERLESLHLNAGIETHSDVRLPGRIPEAIEGIVVKNISEALTNVEKHAHATRVLVAAEEADGGFRIEVTDDGKGFVVSESVHMPGHLGLLAMRERAQLAGGWCHIESEPGAGAKVEFWLPQAL
jgi:signal transduction histidine kinase